MNTIFKLCELAAYFFEALICYFFIQLFFPVKSLHTELKIHNPAIFSC